MVQRINRLLDDALGDPVAGVGNPETVRHVLAGCGSRRIDDEPRLGYLVEGDDVVGLQARDHDER